MDCSTDSKLSFLNSLQADDNWVAVSDSNDILTQKIAVHDSDLACFRSYGMVDAKMEKITDFLWDAYSSEKQMQEADPDIVCYQIVEQIDDNNRICYQHNKLPWPLWPRELLYLQSKIINDTESTILMYSIDSDKIKGNKKCTRAIINISAFIIEQKEEGCMIYRVAHIDPCGLIPKGVVNRQAGKTADRIKQMRIHFSQS
jgi:hypothetical protein